MAIKKSELYSSLWKSCDELRGGMDASQYKDYVLVLLFIKYVSDKYAGKKDALIEIPKGGGFKEMVALKGQKDIGDKINKIIAKLAEANELKGIIDQADFNDEDKLGKGQEMKDRLSNLIGIFENPSLDFSTNRADGDDILGDAYEYLMRFFATQSGKSKGQFYTPAEVSRIMAKIIMFNMKTIQSDSVYDPTCGSGSLLLKVADESEKGISIFGQEMDVTTAALARMNMILHNNPTADIKKGQSTLSTPLFLDEHGRLKLFNFVVANFPFSYKAWSNGFDPANDLYDRFNGYGIPPSKNGDYAFLLHIICSMKRKGKGAVILPHGVLFRGNAEAEIRTNIIRKGYIKGIIGLPPNLFYGTGIPACIIVLDKENAESRKGIFMIDASKGFVKDGNKNRLRDQDIHKIVDVFNRQLEIPKYSRMVPVAEIEEKEFNLNIPRYIDSQIAEDVQDIEAHLKGGIPNADIEALQNYWDVYPSLKKVLFEKSSRAGYSQLKIVKDDIKQTIYSFPEFVTYGKQVDEVFSEWKNKNTPALKKINSDTKPKKLIYGLGESLLQAFGNLKLIDNYDIYQHLMTYWMEAMQDDVYILVSDGWKAGNEVDWDTKGKEYEGKLIPKRLMIQRYFMAEQKAIEQIEADRDALVMQMEEMEEEQGGDEGLLADAKNDKDKINKASVQKRLKEIESEEIKDVEIRDNESKEPLRKVAEKIMPYRPNKEAEQEEETELSLLKKYLALAEQETEANKKIKQAQAELNEKLLKKYKTLTEAEIKTLIVDEKWMAALDQDVKSEMQRISQRLTRRIKELAERYETPLPAMIDDVEDLKKKVNTHLQKMGHNV
jgi:type I restriction enzyme M protein